MSAVTAGIGLFARGLLGARNARPSNCSAQALAYRPYELVLMDAGEGVDRRGPGGGGDGCVCVCVCVCPVCVPVCVCGIYVCVCVYVHTVTYTLAHWAGRQAHTHTHTHTLTLTLSSSKQQQRSRYSGRTCTRESRREKRMQGRRISVRLADRTVSLFLSQPSTLHPPPSTPPLPDAKSAPPPPLHDAKTAIAPPYPPAPLPEAKSAIAPPPPC